MDTPRSTLVAEKSSAFCYGEHRTDSVPKMVALDIHRILTQLNIVVLSTHKVTERVESNFKFWAHPYQSARD